MSCTRVNNLEGGVDDYSEYPCFFGFFGFLCGEKKTLSVALLNINLLYLFHSLWLCLVWFGRVG